jgi:hypothetical protein
MRRDWLVPDWPCPPGVGALLTLRPQGGGAAHPFGEFNLATHVGDDPERVERARARLRTLVGDATIGWLAQVHGTAVVELQAQGAPVTTADAAWTRASGVACAILTADCLPVLLCERDGGSVAAAHGGWRGLADGVLANVVAAMPAPADSLTAWIGPGIGAARYPVGDEVVRRIRERWGDTAVAASIRREGAGRLRADLETLARWQLRALGVRDIHGGGFCTARDPRFYSHRRDGTTGRMAALIWRR